MLTPPCSPLSPGLLVLLGRDMLSVAASPLPGWPQSHTCEYSRSPRAERHADVWLGTAGCPHQERLSQVGWAARQLQHRSPFTAAAELSAQTECCYAPLQVLLWNPRGEKNHAHAWHGVHFSACSKIRNSLEEKSFFGGGEVWLSTFGVYVQSIRISKYLLHVMVNEMDDWQVWPAPGIIEQC